MERILVFAVLMFTAVAVPCFSDTIHVPADQPTIQAGIDEASNGDTVLVGWGIYKENINFFGKAIAVKSTHGPYWTIIDACFSGSGVTFCNGEGSDSVLDGFSFTKGGGTKLNPGSGVVATCGGGILCDGTSPTIVNNMIRSNGAMHGGGICCMNHASPTISFNSITANGASNTSGSDGGGISCWSSSSPTISNNTIANNSAGGVGGGISCRQSSSPIISNNTIANNSCLYIWSLHGEGGGIFCSDGSSPMICNNTISANAVKSYGGGIFCHSGTCPTISNNTITMNNAGSAGGGIYCYWYSNPNISQNHISNNIADKGGGLYCNKASPIIFSNIISKNHANQNGGGIACAYGGNISIISNTLTFNFGLSGGGIDSENGSFLEVVNTILWDNYAWYGPQICLGYWSQPATLSISYSDVEDGQASIYIGSPSTLIWGDGMIDVDPVFVDSANGDFHLTYLSPCKNVGDNSILTYSWDFEGDPRIAYGTVDMGADEFHPHLYYTGEAAPGQGIDLKLIGMPMQPAVLYIGSDLLPCPHQTKYGLWHLVSPISTVHFGEVPWSGFIKIQQRIPPDCPVPLNLPMQSLVRKLTNPEVLEIR